MDMRISVCEFLRITTHRNWFYRSPGKWEAEGAEYQAVEEEGKLFLMRGNRLIKELEYYSGKTAHEVRQAAREHLRLKHTRARRH